MTAVGRGTLKGPATYEWGSWGTLRRMTYTDADRFLLLLKSEPTLLPEAPKEFTGAQINFRVHDEVHSCLRCGKRALQALVAHTDMGHRWLDICYACRRWLIDNATPQYNYPFPEIG